MKHGCLLVLWQFDVHTRIDHIEAQMYDQSPTAQISVSDLSPTVAVNLSSRQTFPMTDGIRGPCSDLGVLLKS